MSMNLECDEMCLPQIPSWPSQLILSADEKGNPDGGWRGVARRLNLYWWMRFDEDFSAANQDAEQQQWARDHYRGLRERLALLVENAPDEGLHFSVV